VALKRRFCLFLYLVFNNAAIATPICFHEKSPAGKINDWYRKNTEPAKKFAVS
jgi:hypothetical protein